MKPSLEQKKVLIGLNITYYRKARKLTQLELADKVEVTSNYLSQVERGFKSVSLVKLIQIADVLGVDETALLDFSRLLDDNALILSST